MKKYFLLLLLTIISSTMAMPQRMDGPFTSSSRISRCPVCDLRHTPACSVTSTTITATPIDGGLVLLLVAGGAYGVRRLRKSQKP